MKTKLILAFLGLALALTNTGCSRIEPPVPVPAVPPCELLPGQSTALVATGGGNATTLEWHASAGQLTPDKGPAVTYTAPKDYSGSVIITVIAKKGNSQEQGQMTCTIIAPPTATPTPTLEPTATSTPSPTITSTPLPPLLEIFSQVAEGKEFVYKNSGGELTNLFLPSQNCIRSGMYGLQLTYNMRGPGNGGWGVQWSSSSVGHFDASAFNALTFWVKGASGGEIFQIGLKDTTGNSGNGYEVKVGSKDFLVVTQDWLPITVPFSEFKGVNTASIENVNLGFNRDHGSGSICIDDIAFTVIP